MREYNAQRKHAKALTRKKKVYAKKEFKKRLTKMQVEQALQNLDNVEATRRKAIQDFLVEQGFTPLESTKENKVASFEKDELRYKLVKLDLADMMKKKLGDEISRFGGLYMIVEETQEKKWIIFQVNYTPDTKKFSIISLHERTWDEL
jgi:hypothetical protein